MIQHYDTQCDSDKLKSASSSAHRERVVDEGARSLLSISKLQVSKRWKKKKKKKNSLLQDKGEHLESRLHQSVGGSCRGCEGAALSLRNRN